MQNQYENAIFKFVYFAKEKIKNLLGNIYVVCVHVSTKMCKICCYCTLNVGFFQVYTFSKIIALFVIKATNTLQFYVKMNAFTAAKISNSIFRG